MKTAIYAGSFDPITNGHIDIIARASNLFDKLIVLVAINKSKNYTFTQQERVEMIRSCTNDLTNVTVDTTMGLVVDYAYENNACAIVKGLRTTLDFNYEKQQEFTNKYIANDRKIKLETVYLSSSENMSLLSSSLIKEIASTGTKINDLIPKQASKLINNKLYGGKL